ASFRVPWSSAITAAIPSMLAWARASGWMVETSTSPPPGSVDAPQFTRRAAAAALLAGVLAALAMTSFAGASLWPAVGALVALYAFGYVVGSLLVAPVE